MNIRLRDKLLTGFVLLGLLIVLIAGGAFYALEKSQSSIQKISELYEHRKIAQSVVSDFSTIKDSIREYEHSGNAQLMSDAQARVEGIAKILTSEKSSQSLLLIDKDHIQSILDERGKFVASLKSVEQLYQAKHDIIEEKINKIAQDTLKKVEGLSEQSFYSGNPDASVSAAVMRGHFLSAIVSAHKIMIHASTKDDVDAFRKAISFYRESGAGLAVYLTDKAQVEDVKKMATDKSFEEAVYQVDEINKKIDEEMLSLESLTVDVTKKIDVYVMSIKNQEDEVSRDTSDVIARFKMISLLLLIIGGGAGAVFVVYLLRALKSTVDSLSAGFMDTQQAIARVSYAAGNVGSNIEIMSSSAIEAGKSGQQIDEQTQTMSNNIGQMSSAMAQLDNSIRQIQAVTAGSLDRVEQAVGRTNEMERVIVEMGKASEQISSVVALINGLSEQTSLLALNATIEAARAGEAGKGFSVVADEVKKLAVATTESTDSIRQQVARIANISRDAMGFMQDLISCVKDIETNSTEINNSIVEQQIGTQSIGENMAKILDFTDAVSQNIQSISTDMVQSGKLAADVQSQTGVVEVEVAKLNDIADEFRARLAKL